MSKMSNLIREILLMPPNKLVLYMEWVHVNGLLVRFELINYLTIDAYYYKILLYLVILNNTKSVTVKCTQDRTCQFFFQ